MEGKVKRCLVFLSRYSVPPWEGKDMAERVVPPLIGDDVLGKAITR